MTTDLPLAWWLEVGALKPLCIYYFGPFESQQETHTAKHGFLQDLENKNVVLAFACSKFCQPRQLTMDKNDLTIEDLKTCPGQFLKSVPRAILWEILDRQQQNIELHPLSMVNRLIRKLGLRNLCKKLPELY
jgi:Domain of unknown function (DUF1816)